MAFVKPMFKKVRAIVPLTFASTTASAASSITSTTYGENFEITLQCVTGTVWVNPLAVATTNSFAITSGNSLDLLVSNTLSLVSDSTLATYQGIVWKEG